jgi:predicted ATPase
LEGRADLPAEAMSDGTLHALGVLLALASGPVDPTSPIAVEEPEAMLHPSASAALLEAIQDAADRRQVLVATHSADLLDHPSIREDQLRAVRMSDGQTHIGRLDAGGQTGLREKLFTPGELLRIDRLNPAEETEQVGGAAP